MNAETQHDLGDCSTVDDREGLKLMRLAVHAHINGLPQLKGKGVSRHDPMREAAIDAFAEKVYRHFMSHKILLQKPLERQAGWPPTPEAMARVNADYEA